MKTVTFYVMHVVNGDECLIAHCTTLAAAALRALREHGRDPRADLSVWTSEGAMILPSINAVQDFVGRVSA